MLRVHCVQLLEKHGLGEAVFEEINAHLAALGHRLKTGVIVDASLIAAPSSTKTRKGGRDPQMHRTKKGNQWYFGMKRHIAVNAQSALVRSLETTPANSSDAAPAHVLFHDETPVAPADLLSPLMVALADMGAGSADGE